MFRESPERSLADLDDAEQSDLDDEFDDEDEAEDDDEYDPLDH
jgi:hypothetical protein